jgi:hypothetical protein
LPNQGRQQPRRLVHALFDAVFVGVGAPSPLRRSSSPVLRAYRLPERWGGPVRMLLLLGPALAWFVNWTSMGG